ncbi:MAG: hypothetical protein AB7F40_05380 [Victivallaceae bacterium]|nr:hypothetical protein [Victivallaceae bacterium]
MCRVFFLTLWLLPLALRAAEPDARERLLAALPADVSFVYIEPGAVMKSGFVAGLRSVKDETFIKLLKPADAFAGLAEAMVLFERLPVDGDDVYSGCLVVSPCANLSEFWEKEAAAEDMMEDIFQEDEIASRERSKDSGIELGHHLFLFGSDKVMADYSAAGLPEDLKPEIDKFEDCQVFGFVENWQACMWAVGGVEFESDRIAVSLDTHTADAGAAERLVGMFNVGSLSHAGMLKVKDPALAERFLESFSCNADGRHVKLTFEVEDAAAVAMFDMFMPVMSKALNRAKAMAAVDRLAGASVPADDSENKNQTGGK